MDARIIPSVALGINEGDSHVIRNAGASAKDALRSLVISQQLLATEEIVVIKHTDCGMLTFTTPQARELVAKNLDLDASSPEAQYLQGLDFLEFPELEQAVKDDVELLKQSKLIKSEKISGWVYDVKTGAVKQVV